MTSKMPLITCYAKDFKVHLWKLPYRTHNAIVHNLSYNLDFQIWTVSRYAICKYGILHDD